MLEIKNLCFGYIKNPLCIKDFNLSIKKGEKVVLLGGEGMGKTTLLKIVSGLETQYFGKVSVDGRDLSDSAFSERNVSYLPTEPVLFENKSLKYNLEYLFKINNIFYSEEDISKIFKKFDFDYELNVKVKNLPLEDKRIFAMIRAYMKNADVLLIDDQFENVDCNLFIKIKNALSVLINKNLNTKYVIVAINKNNTLNFELFDKLYYISYTKIFIVENLEDLKNNPPDLYIENYVDYVNEKVVLKKNNDNFYICTYELVSDKKRKNTIINIKNMIKIKQNDQINAFYNDFENEFIKLKVLSDECISNISDTDFNKRLGKSIFIFDEGTGERLF